MSKFFFEGRIVQEIEDDEDDNNDGIKQPLVRLTLNSGAVASTIDVSLTSHNDHGGGINSNWHPQGSSYPRPGTHNRRRRPT